MGGDPKNIKEPSGDQVSFNVTLQNLHTPPSPPPHGDEIWLEF